MFFVCTRHKFSWRYHLQFLEVCSLSVYPLGIDFIGQLFFFMRFLSVFPFTGHAFAVQSLKLLAAPKVLGISSFVVAVVFPKNVIVLA